MELHHIYPTRSGGLDTFENLIKVALWEHVAIDPYRHFVSSNSKYKKAIVLNLWDFNGEIYSNGKKCKVEKSQFPKLYFWEDVSQKQFTLEIVLVKGAIVICNGADPLGNKVLCKYLSEGCAMIVREDNGIKRYYCNDFQNNDDFDDLVFDTKMLD